MARQGFYGSVVGAAKIDKTASVLVICGGPSDRDVMLESGLSNVVISNLDHHGLVVASYAPFRWERQDAENLTYPDGAFDWTVVHAGLHHCGSPHRAFCEMLRVAKIGVIVIEARDSFLMRLGARLGLVTDFEVEPVVISTSEGTPYGGLRNGPIPNYVYRWTEREVIKTVSSYAPEYRHKYNFHYGLSLPLERIAMSKSPVRRAAVHLLRGAKFLLENFLPRQGNQFAFTVRKDAPLQPWLTSVDGVVQLDFDYAAKTYDVAAYRKAHEKISKEAAERTG